MLAEEKFVIRWRRRRWLGKFWFVFANLVIYGLFFSLVFNYLLYFIASCIDRYLLRDNMDLTFIVGTPLMFVTFFLSGGSWAFFARKVWENNEALFRRLTSVDS